MPIVLAGGAPVRQRAPNKNGRTNEGRILSNGSGAPTRPWARSTRCSAKREGELWNQGRSLKGEQKGPSSQEPGSADAARLRIVLVAARPFSGAIYPAP
ncbi:hypothetical protein DPEC_G00150670 [Dallia pectoralis]|uniref:Uncharacterized protein n=1 Tax=Dallia pectoralis TaxID=75939 RepID=A0ACC2GJ76_DALPE|nr:hypothetical protein DPEC_G00150670 [Dallia pectoralis]